MLCLCGNQLHSKETFDPFEIINHLKHSPAASTEDAQQKITTKLTCVSSGPLEGEELDARVKSIVIAISNFYGSHKRVPSGIEELVTFCEKRGLVLHDLSRLSSVEFIDGTFKYSAHYGKGTLHLSHVSDCYFTT